MYTYGVLQELRFSGRSFLDADFGKRIPPEAEIFGCGLSKRALHSATCTIFVKGDTNMGAVGAMLFLAIYLGIVVYLISMLGRLVRAVERIAAKIENSPRI